MSRSVTKYNCCCDNTNDEIEAYIVYSEDGEVTGKSEKILPQRYEIENRPLIKCKNGCKLIFVSGNQKTKPHFRHEHHETTSKWHLEWQSKFVKFIDCSVEHTLIDEDIWRRPDVLIGSNVAVEFQHSPIQRDGDNGISVNERTRDLKKHCERVIWVVDCTDKNIVEETSDIRITLNNNKWKYESFQNVEFYLDIGSDRIVRIKSDSFKNVVVKIKKDEKVISYSTFVDKLRKLQSDTTLQIVEYADCINTGTIYLNQRCAGSGKTYSIIRLIYEADDIKYNKFKDKKRIIYLSKTHSSKDVIRSELQEHFSKYKKLIVNAEESDETKKSKDTKEDSKKQNKQHRYVVTLLQVGGIQKNLIIATIDSFNYKIGNENYEPTNLINNIFDKLVESIVNNDISSTSYYGHKIDGDCLIIVDEVQDLSYKYIQALDTLREKTGVDIYLVGDKLQSIYTMDNIFVNHLDRQKFPHLIEYKRDEERCVRRFKSEKYVGFVNSIVKFTKYDLEEIKGIGEETCYTKPDIFEICDIYTKEDSGEWDLCIKNIIEKVDYEVNEYGRFPEDFLFIFPVMNYNKFADKLYNRVIKYFIDKITIDNKNEEYQAVLKKGKPKGNGTFEKYWTEENIDSIKRESDIWSGEFVEYHTSQVGKPIDLISSEHKARFVSIHASKGDGRNVVFLLGMTEEKLYNFTNREINLQYESFINVSVTRQKESLYVGVIPNGDDIHKRFFGDSVKQKTNFKIKCSLDSHDITKNISQSIKLIDYGIDIDSIKPVRNNKELIDNNHHIIRYSVIYYKVLSDLFTKFKSKKDKYKQYEFVFERLKSERTQVKSYCYDEYYEKLTKIKEGKNKDKYVFVVDYVVPFLEYSGVEKCKKNVTLQKMMKVLENVRIKLNIYNKQSNEFPYMCPIESVVLYYVLELYIQGQYSTISIKDVYYIFETYEFSGHDDQCGCNSIFGGITDRNQSKIKIHYDQLNVLKNFNEKIIKRVSDICEGEIIIDTLSKEYFYGYQIEYAPGKDVSIKSIYDFIIYSDEVLFNIILIPELNDLNKTEIFTEGLIRCFILANQLENRTDKGENLKYEKFNGKHIKLCIVSLNNEPEIIDIDIEKLNKLSNLLKEYVKTHFERYYKMIRDFCEVHELKIDEIKRVIQKNIKFNGRYDKENPFFPKYICNALLDKKLNKQIKKCENFKTYLSTKLDEFIENFLTKEDNESEDESE